MKKTIFLFTLFAISLGAKAQNQKIAGVWTLVSVENINTDSSRTYPYGNAPAGQLIFEASGNYSVQILKATRPKIASGNKSTATAEENIALVQGSNSHFGKYRVNEKENTINYQVENAFFPNWEGKELVYGFILEGDILKTISNNTSFGGNKALVTWKRKK